MSSVVALATYRFGNFLIYRFRVPVLKQTLYLLYRIWDSVVVKAILGVDIPARSRIGHHLKLPHGAKGVVIHPDAVIGNYCTIYHQVTVGGLGLAHHQIEDKPSLENRSGGVPIIGERVLIGTGAKVLGPVNIGNGVRIGANAVVLQDIPSNHTAFGIPAQIRPQKRQEVASEVQPSANNSS